MKHYLDLIQISAKQHKKQNRMTRLCIVLAVFLVTVIFGMADMEIRSQMIQAVKSDGSWHAGFLVDEEQGALLKARPEVEHIARYGVLNYHLRDGYRIEGIETAICGFDKELLEMFPAAKQPLCKISITGSILISWQCAFLCRNLDFLKPPLPVLDCTSWYPSNS